MGLGASISKEMPVWERRFSLGAAVVRAVGAVCDVGLHGGERYTASSTSSSHRKQ